MRNSVYFLVAAVVLAAPATAEKNSLISLLEGKIIESSFRRGENQILAADISPKCRELALTNLAAAKQNAMTCDGTLEVLEDVGSVLDVAFDSTADLITDLNTVINGIPSCVSDYSWWNFVGMMSCLVGQVKPIWNASINFVHFQNYYMNTINKISELMNCISGSKTEADQSVKKIVSMAKLCKIH